MQIGSCGFAMPAGVMQHIASGDGEARFPARLLHLERPFRWDAVLEPEPNGFD